MADKKSTTSKSTVKKTPEQAAKAQFESEATDQNDTPGGPLGQALSAVRTPVYAYVGVNDLAIQAVSGLVSDLRRRAEEAVTDAQTRVTERVSEVQNKVTGRVADVQNRVNEVPDRVQALPSEVEELVSRFRPEELRKVADAYVQVAAGIYGGLAARGEDVVSRLREENPQLEAGLARVNEQVARAAGAVEEQVELGEEALGTVARQTRSIGVKAAGRVSKNARQAAAATGDAADKAAGAADKAAEATGKVADKAADKVGEAAFAASDEVQSGAGKVEARTAPAKKAPAKKAPAKKAPAAQKPAAKPAASTTASAKPAASTSTSTSAKPGQSSATSSSGSNEK